MKIRSTLQIKVLDYLLGKSCLNNVYDVQLIANTLNISLTTLKTILKDLEEEGIVHSITGKDIELTDKITKEVKDLSEIYITLESTPQISRRVGIFR